MRGVRCALLSDGRLQSDALSRDDVSFTRERISFGAVAGGSDPPAALIRRLIRYSLLTELTVEGVSEAQALQSNEVRNA